MGLVIVNGKNMVYTGRLYCMMTGIIIRSIFMIRSGQVFSGESIDQTIIKAFYGT